MARQSIKIEIAGGQINFKMHNFGKLCDKEAKFLEELGTVVSSERDATEYNKQQVRVKEKNG